VLQLVRTVIAIALAAWTAVVAAAPPCAEDLATACCKPADARDEAPCGDAEHDEGCDLGCAICACCRPPVASPASLATAVPPGREARVDAGPLALERDGAPAEIFQPPRA
jgi:hypothetical protein